MHDNPAHDVSEATRKVDILFDNMVELTAQVRRVCEVTEGRNVQTVIHKSTGMGAWGAAAVVACFATWVMMLMFGIWTVFQVNNLAAWKDVHGSKIAVLEGKQK
jgi:hypothetical protein